MKSEFFEEAASDQISFPGLSSIQDVSIGPLVDVEVFGPSFYAEPVTLPLTASLATNGEWLAAVEVAGVVSESLYIENSRPGRYLIMQWTGKDVGDALDDIQPGDRLVLLREGIHLIRGEEIWPLMAPGAVVPLADKRDELVAIHSAIVAKYGKAVAQGISIIGAGSPVPRTDGDGSTDQ